jgi:hypothetical protein
MTPRRTKLHKLLAATALAVGLSVGLGTMAAPAFADGWRGHERYEHRGHEWRGHEWREHHDWRYYHPYRSYGYGYAYPGYYAPPPAVYAPPSFTVVVPFR